MRYARIIGFSAGLVTLVLDQLSKQLVLSRFFYDYKSIEVTSFFNIILAANKGVSFGLFAADSPYGVWALIAVAACISLLLTVWIWQGETRFAGFCFGLILGGALGNVIDRLYYGAVIDFLDFHLLGYHWYTFNIADCGIVIGTVLLICQTLFSVKNDNNDKA